MLGFCVALVLPRLFRWGGSLLAAKGAQPRRSLISLKNRVPIIQQQPVRLERFEFGGMTTFSPRVAEIFRASRIIATSTSTVLIESESGTGKGHLARAIHAHSNRAAKPFVAVHAASLPENLLEAELFGHVKGAFTGAIKERVGRFEMAQGGTLFLDEVGEFSPMLQVKLLRVLQEKCFERVGSSETIQVNVRIIAATNQNLLQLVREKKFREDLYYRLNVVCLRLIPLRERREDIPQLIDEILAKLGQQSGRTLMGYTDDFLATLKEHTFPGNIRELENIIERALVFCPDRALDRVALSFMDQVPSLQIPRQQPAAMPFNKRVDLEQIVQAYHVAKGNKAAAARGLGMRESTFRYHLKRALEGRGEGLSQ